MVADNSEEEERHGDFGINYSTHLKYKRILSECLDSILKQTYKNIRVILGDNGSTDGSLEICKSESYYFYGIHKIFSDFDKNI